MLFVINLQQQETLLQDTLVVDIQLYQQWIKLPTHRDTTVAVPGAALSVARDNLAASSSRANALTQPPAATPTPQAAITTVPIGYDTGYFGGSGPYPARKKR